MKKISEPILFFGNERLATAVSTTAPALRALVEAGYDIKAVIANHTDPISKQGRDLEIGILAHSLGIPVILPGKNIPLKEKVLKHRADAAVLVAFGKIIPQEVINLFPKGIINIHPSLLPELRGSTPVETAILNGLTQTGVTLMKLSAKMDAGPIYAQQKVALNGQETKAELAAKLNQVGAELLIKHLPKILDGSLKPIAQDDSAASYTKMITKEDGRIDWHKPANQIEREIRAFADWPKSYCTLAGQEVIITKAHAVPSTGINEKPGELNFVKQASLLGIATSNGTLWIDRLKPAGKKELSIKEFLSGYQDRL